MSRTLFIGDIHGCYDELVELYEHMKISEGDTVSTTGDLINKGPKSQKVAQFIREKCIQSVLGNHERAFLHEIDERAGYFKNFQSLMDQFTGHEEDLGYLKSLPYWIDTDRFLLVHAGLVPGIPLENQDTHDLVKIRMYEGKPWYEYYDGEKLIIYGHWAKQGIMVRPNSIGLDSGCVYGKELTGFCLETGEIWQVKAKEVYVKPDKD